MRLILGSASPRRHALLAQIGAIPDAVDPADIDETPKTGETPQAYVKRMAAQKNAALSADDNALVLTADTSVVLGRRILGKAKDKEQAQAYLQMLSGRRHQVLSALYLRHGARHWARLVRTGVKFKRISDVEMRDYIASNEWQGKAGAYAIQGIAAAFVTSINGSYSNVVGLPLAQTAALLQGAGYPLSQHWHTK